MDRQQRTETGWPGPDAELSLRTRLWARREQQRELAELSENKKMPKQGHFFVQRCGVFLFFFFFSFPCREHLGSCLRFERHLAASLPAAPKGEPGEWGGNKRAAGGSRGEAAGEKGSWEEERQRAALIACPRIPAARESPPPPCSSRHLHVASRAQPKNRSPPRCACSATKAAIYPFLNSSCVVYESLGEGKR